MDRIMGREWNGQNSTKGKRVRVSNAAKILSKVVAGKSAGFGERNPVREISAECWNPDGSWVIKQQVVTKK